VIGRAYRQDALVISLVAFDRDVSLARHDETRDVSDRGAIAGRAIRAIEQPLNDSLRERGERDDERLLAGGRSLGNNRDAIGGGGGGKFCIGKK